MYCQIATGMPISIRFYIAVLTWFFYFFVDGGFKTLATMVARMKAVVPFWRWVIVADSFDLGPAR